MSKINLVLSQPIAVDNFIQSQYMGLTKFGSNIANTGKAKA
ncbi:MAG: hypothetical protein ABGX37_04610 [Methylococcales bacterium]